jgi:hypothetical protein
MIHSVVFFERLLFAFSLLVYNLPSVLAKIPGGVLGYVKFGEDAQL